jgi:DNA polymerase III epsilon subunit-like protein
MWWIIILVCVIIFFVIRSNYLDKKEEKFEEERRRRELEDNERVSAYYEERKNRGVDKGARNKKTMLSPRLEEKTTVSLSNKSSYSNEQIETSESSEPKRNPIDRELDIYAKELEKNKEWSSATIYRRGATFFESDIHEPYYFVFDCETTGLPGDGKVNRIVQLAWLILDRKFCLVKEQSYYLNPGKPIPVETTDVHHITDKMVKEKSTPHTEALTKFHSDLESCIWIIAHNFSFDAGRVDMETRKAKIEKPSLMEHKKSICTMERGTNYCRLTPKVYGTYKWPTLDELASKCGFRAEGLHDALNDVRIAAKCFEIMVREGYIKRKGIDK